MNKMLTWIIQAQATPVRSDTSITEWFLILLLFVLAGVIIFSKDKKGKSNPIKPAQEEDTTEPEEIHDNVGNSQQRVIQRLKDLQALKEAGLLSEKEIEQEKRRIMNKTDGQ